MSDYRELRLAYGRACTSLAMDELAASEMMDMQAHYDVVMRATLVRINRWVLEQEAERILCSYPADWWQAVRQRWAPKWWLKRHPVQMTTKMATVKATYPTLIHPPKHGPVMKIVIKDEPGGWE